MTRYDRIAVCAAATLAAVLLLLSGCGGGGGSDNSAALPPASSGDSFTDATLYSSSPGGSLAVASEATAVTHFQTTIAGTAIPYTATAGHLTANRLATDAPMASFF